MKNIYRFIFAISFLPYLFNEIIYLALIVFLIIIILLKIGFGFNLRFQKSLLYFTILFIFPFLTIFYNGFTFLIPILFHVLPLIFVFLVSLDSNLELDSTTLKFLLSAIYIGIFSLIYQNYVDPDLFGLIRHVTYNSDLFGTSTFRPIGLFGSPQNASLFVSIGLFLPFNSRIEIIIRFLIIILVAVLLKSTFLGVAILLLFFKNFFKITLLISIIVIVSLGTYLLEDQSNTSFEFLNFSEAIYFYNRFYLSNFSTFNFWNFLTGMGPGTATQGMIDRGFVTVNYFEAESYFFIILHEFGLLYLSFLLIFLFRNSIKYFLNRNNISQNFFYITIIFFFSMLVTPSFSSLRVKVIAFLLIYSMSNHLKKIQNV